MASDFSKITRYVDDGRLAGAWRRREEVRAEDATSANGWERGGGRRVLFTASTTPWCSGRRRRPGRKGYWNSENAWEECRDRPVRQPPNTARHNDALLRRGAKKSPIDVNRIIRSLRQSCISMIAEIGCVTY